MGLLFLEEEDEEALGLAVLGFGLLVLTGDLFPRNALFEVVAVAALVVRPGLLEPVRLGLFEAVRALFRLGLFVLVAVPLNMLFHIFHCLCILLLQASECGDGEAHTLY